MYESFKLDALPVHLQAKICVKPNTSCWLWLGYVNEDGYARSSGRWEYLHRRIYEFFRGKIPEGLGLDHLCRTRSCLNPAHLEPVTSAENQRRGRVNQNKDKSHCEHGHPFDAENTVIYSGKRQCRACRKARNARYYREKRKRGILNWPPPKQSSDRLE